MSLKNKGWHIQRKEEQRQCLSFFFFFQFSFFREFDRLGVRFAHRKGRKPLSRKEQKQFTREMLLHTALKLFVQKGYDNVTVNDIVLKAGSSKGGFYHHFISKSAILLDYGNTLHNKLLDRLRLTALQHEASCSRSDHCVLFGFERILYRKP
jgi:AcrR family transcriptional regulator